MWIRILNTPRTCGITVAFHAVITILPNIYVIIIHTKFSVTGEYENFAKNRPAWGYGIAAEDKPIVSDGIDDDVVMTGSSYAARWAFIAVDLEVQRNIGYIRVLMAASKYITL